MQTRQTKANVIKILETTIPEHVKTLENEEKENFNKELCSTLCKMIKEKLDDTLVITIL